MRYFRVTLNPTSPVVVGGTTTIRLRFAVSPAGPERMIYATFVDGMLVAVPDSEMGAFGGPTDYLMDIDVAQPYKIFQDVVPVLPDLGVIPVWTSQLVPYDASPAVQPTPWPAVQVQL